MSTRPLPEHGTRARYLRGCRCTPCSNAHYRYMSHYKLHQHRVGHRRVEAAPAQQRVAELLAAGWHITCIARRAGVSLTAARSLATRKFPGVNRDIAARILAVPATEPAPDGRYVDSTGTVRRLRALVAMGHTLLDIAHATGINQTPLSVIARGERPLVEPRTRDAVAVHYRRACHTPGLSQRSRNLAAKRGWHGPLAWDDIDDPAAQPELDTTREGPRAQAHAETWEELAAQGYTREHAAARMGIHRETLNAAVARVNRERCRQDMETAA